MTFPEPDNALLSLKQISLNYGQFSALKHIDFNIKKSEIHAVIGEHGAGKSSLAQILSGYKKPDSGTICWNGKPLSLTDPQDAKNIGIEIVMQEIEQYDQLSIAQNLFGNDSDFFRKPFFSRKELNRKADSYFEKLGFSFRGEKSISTIKDTDKVLLELLKHLLPEPGLLILDETFEKMTAVDLNKMIPILKQLVDEGLSILFITHRIDDVYTFADRVTVIRNGLILTTESVRNIDKINLIKLAYTQVVQESSLDTTTQEFYQLLKYNRAILETLPVNLLVVDENLILRLLNNNAKNYFNIGDTPAIGRSLSDFFTLNSSSDIAGTIIESIERRRLESFTVRLKLHAHSETINTVTTYPIHDGALYIGSMIILGDITEQEKLREKLTFAEKLGSVGLLAAGVSHEINNPLEIILNELDYVRKLLPSGEANDILTNIEEEVESIEQIVSNLAAFSDSSADKTEPIDINSQLTRILELVKHNAVQRNIRIIYDPPEAPVFLNANKTEIKQVILNIVKNSFEAIHKDGTLEARLFTESSEKGNIIKLIFIDSGPGISEEDRHSIFLPFFSKKHSSGTNMGLGLSVSYGIINKMKGKITVENSPFGGCIFTISLPA